MKIVFETDEQLLQALASETEFGVSKLQRIAYWGYNRSARKIDELLLAGKIQQLDGTPYLYRVCVALAADQAEHIPLPTI